MSKEKNHIIVIVLAIITFFIVYQDKIIGEKNTMEIHNEIITLDTHCDIDINNFTDSNNYTINTNSQVNLPKMIDGGLDVAWFIVFTGQDSLNKNGYKRAYKNCKSIT